MGSVASGAAGPRIGRRARELMGALRFRIDALEGSDDERRRLEAVQPLLTSLGARTESPSPRSGSPA